MFRKFIAFMFSIVFIGFTLLISVFYSFDNVFASKKNYLSDEFISLAYDYSIDKTTSLVDLEENDLFKDKINSSDIQNILMKSVSKENFKEVMVEYMNFLIEAPVDKETGNVSVVFPTSWILNYKKEINKNLSEYIYKEIPKCVSLQDFDEETLNCIPENLSFDFIDKQIQVEMDKLIYSNIPDDYVLVWHVPYSVNQNLSSVYSKVLSNIYSLLLIGTLFSLCIVVLFIFKPFTSVLKWVLINLFSSSVLILALFLSIFKLLVFKDFFVNLFWSSNDPFYYSFYEYFSEKLFQSVFPGVLIVLCLSLVLFIFISIRYKKNNYV